jgi:hypothetical protein
MVTLLQACLQLVKKKLKPGTPTGDILDAVIAGEDGLINEEAKSCLTRLQNLARLSNDNYDNTRGHPKRCRHCEKVETLDSGMLMKCQRCKVTYYCSRECQVSNWKDHKGLCSELGSTEKRSAYKTQFTTLWVFVESNHFDIVKEVYKKAQEYNVPREELLVELDFYGDAPALRNEFKVRLTSDFFEESAPINVPSWFQKDDHSKALRGIYEQVPSDDMLVVCRVSNGNMNINCVPFPLVNTGDQLLSGEAVESVGR